MKEAPMWKSTTKTTTGPSMDDLQALAEQSFSGYRIDRIRIADREWEGPGIRVIPPYKGRPYWQIDIYDQETVFAAGTDVVIFATRLPQVPEDNEEMPEEE